MDFTNMWAMDMNAQRFFYNNTEMSHPDARNVSYTNNNDHSGSVKRSLEGPFVTPSEKRVKRNPSSSTLEEVFASTNIEDEKEDPFTDFSSFSPSLDNFEAFNHVYYYPDAAELFDNDGEEFRNPFVDAHPLPEAPFSSLFSTPNPNSYSADIVPQSTNPFHPNYVEPEVDTSLRWDGPFCKNDTVSGVVPVEKKPFVDTTPMRTESVGESPIFCPVPRRDSRWVFSMDDSDDEAEDEIERPVSHPGIGNDNNNWEFTMNDSDDEEGDFSISDYEMEAEPSSPPRSEIEKQNWSSEGNPFREAIHNSLLNEVFSEMNVEGLIYDCGMDLQDNDHLRFLAEDEAGLSTSLWKLQPHHPYDECGCHWCESYRVGGNWEKHDPTIWCSCVPCLRFRVNQHEARRMEEERRWNEQMQRMHAESREAVKEEETRFIDLMDFVPDEDEQRQSRASLFRTIKDRLRRSPRSP